ncbi:MAG: hypothetical protein Q8R82_07205 [Hyphomonadaceae bacterium]|nr:hypothetical protein [Hyphomonadaceae bacterium]
MTANEEARIEQIHDRIRYTWALYVQTKRTLNAIDRIVEGLPAFLDTPFEAFFRELLQDEGSLFYLRLSALFDSGRSPTHSVPHLLAFLEQQRSAFAPQQIALLKDYHLDSLISLGRSPWERLQLFTMRFDVGEHQNTILAARVVRDTTVAHADRTKKQSRLQASVNMIAAKSLLEEVRRFILIAGVTYLPKGANSSGEFGAISNPDRTDISRLMSALLKRD